MTQKLRDAVEAVADVVAFHAFHPSENGPLVFALGASVGAWFSTELNEEYGVVAPVVVVLLGLFMCLERWAVWADATLGDPLVVTSRERRALREKLAAAKSGDQPKVKENFEIGKNAATAQRRPSIVPMRVRSSDGVVRVLAPHGSGGLPPLGPKTVSSNELSSMGKSSEARSIAINGAAGASSTGGSFSKGIRKSGSMPHLAAAAAASGSDGKNDPRDVDELVRRFFSPESKYFPSSLHLTTGGDVRAAASRALNARKHKLDAAAVLLEQTLEWRQKAAIDTIMLRPVPAESVAAVRRAMCDGFYGRDREGTACYYAHAGQFEMRTLKTQAGGMENILNYHTQLMEYNQRVYLAKFNHVDRPTDYQVVCVLDLKGFGSHSVSGDSLSCMQACSGLDAAFYYECFKLVLIVNAPTFFRFFWRTISALLQPETREKFKVLSSFDDIRVWISPENVPKSFGGTYEGPCFGESSPHIVEMDAYFQRIREDAANASVASTSSGESSKDEQ